MKRKLKWSCPKCGMLALGGVLLFSTILFLGKKSKELDTTYEISSEGYQDEKRNVAFSTQIFKADHVDKTMAEHESILEDRRMILQKACTKTSHTLLETDPLHLNNRLVYNAKENLLYCQIPKVGSTTIKKILYHMDSGYYNNSPFIKTLDDIDSHMKYGRIIHKSDLKRYNESFKVIFVRDPYARLFSGYADKLFMVNYSYWRKLGKHIVKRFRKDASDKSVQCGHDVSFAELVKYFISTHSDPNLDWHFKPMHMQCRPCLVEYNVVGKIETFKSDIKYIWEYMNAKLGKKVSFPGVGESAEKGEIKEKLVWLFDEKKLITKCISFYEAMKRTWNTYQIRGVIAGNVSMPFTEDDSKDMTKTRFKEAVYAAMSQSGSKSYRSQCKRSAMTEAYKSVPMSDRLLLQKVFTPDCDLFGYDCNPDIIFAGTAT